MVSKEYFGEDKNIEFKREIPNKHEKFLKDIIAFSNSTCGKVILGVEDETCIVYGIGEQSPFKLSDAISTMISDACTPQIEPDITIKTIEDKTVLEIDVAPGKFGPYYIGNKGKETTAYIRINGTSRAADARKLQELELEGQGISYDSLQDIGREFDQKEFTGPIQEQVDETYQFVLRHINMGANIEGLYRSDVYELPITAIREMIANAVLHRSYLDRSCIQVCIFDDRIEVLSPGMLYGGLDIVTAKHGKSTCRNEAIAEAFHYMKIVEAWGTGIPRIISRCKEYGLQEPLFEELGDGFMVTMFRKVINGTLKVSNAFKKVSSKEQKVGNEFTDYAELLKKIEISAKFIANIKIVFENSGTETVFGQADIMTWLDCSKSKATNVMNAMKQANVIEKVKGRGAGKYKFVDEIIDKEDIIP